MRLENHGTPSPTTKTGIFICACNLNKVVLVAIHYIESFVKRKPFVLYVIFLSCSDSR
jgi:hypothetical protein